MRWIGSWWKIKVNHTLGGEQERKLGIVVEPLTGRGLKDANTIGVYSWEGDL